jgi:FG-GAP-like repeat/FG-GAP repeat
MTSQTWKMAMLGASALIGLSIQPADAGQLPTWKKTVVEGKFRSEGVTVADVNKDGKNDVLNGDFWYEAPSWTKHEIRKPGDFGTGEHSYSKAMAIWTEDVNADGWPDQVLVGFPGDPAIWYENPKNQGAGHWAAHEIWHSACNETPLYADLFGDGKRVLVMGWQPKGKDNEGTMAWFTPASDPTKPWEMHAVSALGGPTRTGIPGTQKFSHGLGVGDINGDSRPDVICTAGWWEQPESGRKGTSSWTWHPGSLGEAAADMIAYDITGDGKADVIASSAHKFGIWAYEQGEPKNGNPTFTRQVLFPDLISETHALIAADINGDGLKDLITGKRFWSHGRSEPGANVPARIYWLQAEKSADGKITFTPREIDNDSGIGTQFTVTDFNGDGLLDVVVSNKKGVFILEQVAAGK